MTAAPLAPIPDTLPLAAAADRVWDAVVLGAGPAGALVARQLALAGAEVLLVDRKRFPRPKICGGCLNGQALAVLRSVGLGRLVDDLGAIEPSGFEVHYRGRVARFPMSDERVVSRLRFDAALVSEAVAAGARLVQDAQAAVASADAAARHVRLTRGGESVVAPGRVVIVAAGLGNTCLDREPNFVTRVARQSRIGIGCTIDPCPDAYRGPSITMAVGCEGYLGLVCDENGRLNAAAALGREAVRRRGSPAQAAVALLAEAGCPPVPAFLDVPWIGTPGLTRATRPIAGNRLLLIGDATGYVEPFTGQGMAWALVSAQAAAPLALRARAALEWDPAIAHDWSRTHARLVGGRRRICQGLAAASRRPWLARLVFAAAARAPVIAQVMMYRINAAPILCEAG